MKIKCNVDNMNYAFNNNIDMRMCSLKNTRIPQTW